MPYNPFSVANRVRELPHTDPRVITECSIIRYSKSCLFLHCTIFEYDKLRNMCLIKHALGTLSVHY